MINFYKKFVKRPLPDPEYTFSGSLIISQMNIDSSNQNESPSLTIQCSQSLVQPPPPSSKSGKSKLSLLRDVAATAITGGASSQSRERSKYSIVPNNEPMQRTSSFITRMPTPISSANLECIKKWAQVSQEKPQSEMTCANQPCFICNYENLVFSVDQTGVLNVYEKSFKVELKLKHNSKLNIPNVRGLAINEHHLAICYSGLKKDQLKGTLKNLSPSGVLIFKRDGYVVCTVHERHLEIGNDQSFKSPSGIAMTHKYLFVCDRELRSVFQFEMKTFALTNVTHLENGEPNSLSVNSDHLLVSDALNSILYLYDPHSLTTLNTASVKSIDKTQGALGVFINEDDLIFVRISESQLALIDINFELRAYFTEIQAKISSVTYLKDQQNHMLVVGGVSGKHSKLYGFSV
jgi:hypothetical protein